MAVKGQNLAVDRPFGWHVYEVTPDADQLTGTVDIVLDTLPANTRIIDCQVVVTGAEAGATSSALDIEVGVIELLDCGADSLGTVSHQSIASESGSAALANAALGGVAADLNCEITYAGTATTAPTFIVAVLMGRFDY